MNERTSEIKFFDQYLIDKEIKIGELFHLGFIFQDIWARKVFFFFWNFIYYLFLCGTFYPWNSKLSFKELRSQLLQESILFMILLWTIWARKLKNWWFDVYLLVQSLYFSWMIVENKIVDYVDIVNDESFWLICLKVSLSFGICFQLNSMSDEINSRFWSPLEFEISSLSPDRTWKLISSISFTIFLFLFIYLFILTLIEIKKLIEKEKREKTYNEPKDSFLPSFPKE